MPNFCVPRFNVPRKDAPQQRQRKVRQTLLQSPESSIVQASAGALPYSRCNLGVNAVVVGGPQGELT